MHRFLPFPLVGGKVESLYGIQDIVPIIATDKIQNIWQRNNSKPASFFAYLDMGAIPFISSRVEYLYISYSFFPFFTAEEVELFLVWYAAEFGAVGVEGADLLPVEGEEV